MLYFKRPSTHCKKKKRNKKKGKKWIIWFPVHPPTHRPCSLWTLWKLIKGRRLCVTGLPSSPVWQSHSWDRFWDAAKNFATSHCKWINWFCFTHQCDASQNALQRFGKTLFKRRDADWMSLLRYIQPRCWQPRCNTHLYLSGLKAARRNCAFWQPPCLFSPKPAEYWPQRFRNFCNYGYNLFYLVTQVVLSESQKVLLYLGCTLRLLTRETAACVWLVCVSAVCV